MSCGARCLYCANLGDSKTAVDTTCGCSLAPGVVILVLEIPYPSNGLGRAGAIPAWWTILHFLSRVNRPIYWIVVMGSFVDVTVSSPSTVRLVSTMGRQSHDCPWLPLIAGEKPASTVPVDVMTERPFLKRRWPEGPSRKTQH